MLFLGKALTNVVFTNCGLCTLCKKEGVEEFTKSLCATDYITMSFANCHLERQTTLAEGNSCCDFHIRRF
ncbi:L-2-amino-thiazoline-4-carboxylic acid hydrolase [Romboutsia sp.]|uniref:L-2-amino-thiazoline-4-carboxylic acid hydrolase n=1 Tax=Romboutsia sp. TaxID=1965302 RepID=UPI003F3A3A58